MLKINLKPEFADREISFNNSGAPLGTRSDLNKLLILAHKSGREDYLAMFENPPSLADLLEEVVDKSLGEIPETTALEVSTQVDPNLASEGTSTPAQEPGADNKGASDAGGSKGKTTESKKA